MHINLPPFEQKIGVAVSGGGDSIALLLLLLQYIPKQKVVVLHFNHNLRKEAATEAEWVRNFAHSLGVACVVGQWGTAAIEGSLQQAARRARYAFFAGQAQALGLEYVCVGHTADDVAETFLMRLLRGSGLKGLSHMPADTTVEGVRVVRPMLHLQRQQLRIFLKDAQQIWVEDPSNENDKFFRIKMRNLLQHVDGLGFCSVENITASAQALARADAALAFYAAQALAQFVSQNEEGVLLQRAFLQLPLEVQLRVVDALLVQVSGQGLAPRSSKKLALIAKMANSQLPATLGGVYVAVAKNGFIFSPEKQRSCIEEHPNTGVE